MKKIQFVAACVALLTLPAVACAANNAEAPDLSTELTRISVYLQTDIHQAFKLIDKLKAQYPDNPKVLAAEAEAYSHINDPVHARLLLKRAHQLDPSDDDITEALKDADLPYKPFALIDGDFKKTKGDPSADERIGHIMGEGRVNGNWAFGTVLENDYISTKPLLTSNGLVQSFHENRQQGELYLRDDRDNGDMFKVSLYGSEGTVGGGAQYQLLEAKGWTALEANYHKPDWDDTVVGVVDEGTKDNIKLSQLYRINEQITGTLGAALNRYGLSDDSDIASTYQFLGGLAYAFDPKHVHGLLGNNSTASVNYGLDAEYLFDDPHQVRDLATGETLSPVIAFPSHQIHSLTLNASKEWGAGVWRLEGSGGYAVDVLGGSGPLLEASFVYQPVDAFDAALKASRSLLHEQSSETIDEFGFELKWKFL